jgi:hypothetical protein
MKEYLRIMFFILFPSLVVYGPVALGLYVASYHAQPPEHAPPAWERRGPYVPHVDSSQVWCVDTLTKQYAHVGRNRR